MKLKVTFGFDEKRFALGKNTLFLHQMILVLIKKKFALGKKTFFPLSDFGFDEKRFALGKKTLFLHQMILVLMKKVCTW